MVLPDHRTTARPSSSRRQAPRDSTTSGRPFLKWVGGKRQLLPALLGRFGEAAPFERYHEPFVGGGAAFFALRARPEYRRSRVRLSDVNHDLIRTYQAVRDNVEGVIRALQVHAAQHNKNYYYELRSQRPEASVDLAAWLIYLNKTGYNGLYRVNSKGGYNVPMGSYVNPTICNPTVLREASEALRGVEVEQAPFESVLSAAEPGDLVYFDPPYVPVSKTASFTGYSADGFSAEDQKRLADTFRELSAKNVRAVLSNSFTPAVVSLYRGFTVTQVQARRAVNSKADRRGEVSEYVISNF